METDIAKSFECSKIVPEVTITSLRDFVCCVESLSKYWRDVARRRSANEEIVGEKFPGEIVPWFRGVSDSRYMLEPGLLRDCSLACGTKYVNRGQIKQLESYMLWRFKAAGLPFAGLTRSSDIDWLFLMQHHGLPTRLLDWSKNALIALYFAVGKHDKKHTEAAVWAIDPRRLNEACQLGRSITFPHSKQQRKIEDYCLLRYAETDPTYPIPLIPNHVSTRLSAQHSRFTFHSDRRGSLNRFATDLFAVDRSWYLVKIVIGPSHQPAILRALRLFGVTQTDIMPGLDSLATEVLQRITFGVDDLG
jgi:FRG domain